MSGNAEEFDLDVLVAEATYAPFRFRLGGRQRELPHPRALRTELSLRLERGEVEVVLRELDSDLAREVLDLPSHATEKLMERWLKHAGLKPGESPAFTRS